jgi:hypothetical protein
MNQLTRTKTRPSRLSKRRRREMTFFANILAPGSSLNPTFLLVVDGVLALLASTLLSLIVVTGGNVHLIALLFIELALWASIKW